MTPAAAPQVNLKPGAVLCDKYRLEQELGRGGFGIVFRAVHLTLDQRVAIKVLTESVGKAEWAADVERFKREAQATAALRSAHVVRILDVDVLGDGRPYMVMEHLDGETLHVATHRRGPLSVQEAVDVALEVLAALAEAHAAGIVHRDLKPANVFITRAARGPGVTKVLDFGVSKTRGAERDALTKTGAVLGTVAYMAPEQLRDAKRADARADLWAVGHMLYEALTKQTPFGPVLSPAVVTAILGQPPVPLATLRRDLPPALVAEVMRCLEKDPARRPPTARVLAEALAAHASPRGWAALESIRRTGPPAGPAAPADAARRSIPASPRTLRARASSRVLLAVGLVVLGAAVGAGVALAALAR